MNPSLHELNRYLRKAILAAIFFIPSFVFAQLGSDGLFICTLPGTYVNEYTYLTANANAGDSIISVANSDINDNARFGPMPGGRLLPGDLVMIIQMQGASINGSLNGNTALPDDSTWGAITNYNNCGLWEFMEVRNVISTTQIRFDCKLKNSYSAAGKTQIVRIPRFSSLTINNGGEITCDPWNGTTGGILVIETQGNIVINAGGKIDATGKGFRGGKLLENNTASGINNVGSVLDTYGAEKGEGIAGFQSDYDSKGGRYGKGAPANGGGGGNGSNAGGGGGANGGITASWNGYGNPDLSGSYSNAWNQEFAGRASITSSGGGRGGYTASSSNQDALSVAPGNALWSADNRRAQGGLGGRPLDYSSGRLFLGGGGGAGDQNDNEGGEGGNGGGLVYLLSYGNISGSGQVIANGADGENSSGTPASNGYAGKDGAGGGGGGGGIVLNAVGNTSGITATANGGNGGNQVISKGGSFIGAVNEAEGPGGGGGGGYIASSGGSFTQNALGGINGITNSDALTEFLPNGATSGSIGTTGQSITNFYLSAQNDTVCSGESAILNATLNGNPPPGTVFNWYNVGSGGTAVFTGATYTTPVLTAPPASRFYFVGTCPSSYRATVIVTIVPSFTVNAGNDTTKCESDTVQLTATGAATYSWFPITGLSNPNIANPLCNATVTTTYVVTGTNGCTDTDTIIVNVNPDIIPEVSIVASQNNVCSGTGITFTATPVNGGASPVYQWKINGNNTGLNQNTLTTSSLNNGDVVSCIMTSSLTGCLTSQSDTSNSITMNISAPATASVSIVASQNPVCTGQNVTFTATPVNGGAAPTYQWKLNGNNVGLNQNSYSSSILSDGDIITCEMTSNAVCVSPLTVLSNSIIISVSTVIVPEINIVASQNPFCAGTNVTFTATPDNGGTAPIYQWKVNGNNAGTNQNTFSSITLLDGDEVTCEMTSNAGCVNPATVISNPITISIVTSISPAVSITATQTSFCSGTNVAFNANVTNGGSSPLYQWKVNGIDVGSGLASYASSALNNNDVITCKVTSNANCAVPDTAISNAISVTVTPSVAPTINISASQTNICLGDLVTFSTIITNGGNSPFYQWKVNGNNVGLNQNSFSSSSLNNGDIITCEVTSNAPCTNPAIVISNSISITVSNSSTPTISISASQTNICSGTPVTFNAFAGNAGSNPSYQWQVDGNNVGLNSDTFTTSLLNNGSEVKCILTSNNPCSAISVVESDSIIIAVTNSFNPSVFINASQTTVCDGIAASFKAVPQNTGPNPQILWFVNGVTTGDVDDTYTSTILNDGDEVVVRVTSTAACASPQIVYDTVVITIIPSPVAEAGGDILICKNDSVQLNGVGGISYVWAPITGLSNALISNPFAKPDTTTRYILTVTSSNGCTDKDTLIVTVDTCNSIFDSDLSAFEVYPNPNYGVFYVNIFSDIRENIRIRIHDMNGKILFNQDELFVFSDKKYLIDIRHLASSVYYLSVTDDKRTMIVKINKL